MIHVLDISISTVYESCLYDFLTLRHLYSRSLDQKNYTPVILFHLTWKCIPNVFFLEDPSYWKTSYENWS